MISDHLAERMELFEIYEIKNLISGLRYFGTSVFRYFGTSGLRDVRNGLTYL